MARPEVVFVMCRHLPVEYMREYMARQNHFSVVHLMRAAIQRTSARGLPTKTLVATRSCTEL